MSRILVICLTAAALAWAPVGAGPARAADDDLAKILGGLAILGIVGKVLNDREDRKRAAQADTVDRDRHYRDDRWKDRDSHARRTLPRECLHILDTERGLRRVYGKRCLQRTMANAHRLPRHCERWVYAYGRERPAYGARCLRQAGWTAERRHY
ncbi:hypothetical protein DXV76_13010 [Rhodobacteraceae bacterium CCMM004]|nr:hypothetical protein DXV76_13010 [Rhodobacteraceae bacterium CCMM004]